MRGARMFELIKNRVSRKQEVEFGFTLVELLVVIVILGILAAIVVFAVGGITDKGQNAACDADKKAVEIAEESYYSRNTTYADEVTLVPSYLHEESDLWDVAVTGSGTTAAYSVTPQDPDGSGPQAAVCTP